MQTIRADDNGRVNPSLTLRRAANWANLSTPLGLAVARAGRARVRRGPRGLWLAEGYRLGFPVAGAFTVGNVVVTAHDFSTLEEALPGTLAHEDEHAWQWMACLGLPFLPMYAAAMGVSFLVSGDRAAYNPFERAADLEAGGYLRTPHRWARGRG